MSNNKYENGKIYCLTCIDGYYYIGSTILKLSYRLSNHKYMSKNPNKNNTNLYKHINLIGWENVKIELIEDYPCDSISELQEREDYYIKQAKNNNDKYCLNINRAFISIEEKKEKMSIYYNNHKDDILNYAKKYREENEDNIKIYKEFYNIVNANKRNDYSKKYAEENKEKVENYRKKYYEENKEIIIEKNKQYVENNKELVRKRKKKWTEQNKERIKIESKIKRSENKEKIKEKGKKYYEENKELILEKNKKYREKNKETILKQQAEHRQKNKETIQCECGGSYIKLGKWKHEHTKKHINYTANISTRF